MSFTSVWQKVRDATLAADISFEGRGRPSIAGVLDDPQTSMPIRRTPCRLARRMG